jgi:hypothetical protein
LIINNICINENIGKIKLLPDAEIGEYIAQQIVRGDTSGNFAKMKECLPDVYGHKITC